MCLNNSEKQLLAVASLRLCTKPVVEALRMATILPYRTQPLAEQNVCAQLMQDPQAYTREVSVEDEISISSKDRTPPLGPSYTGDTNAVRVVWDYFCLKMDEERNVSSTQEDWNYLRSQDEVLRDGVLHITSWALFKI